MDAALFRRFGTDFMAFFMTDKSRQTIIDFEANIAGKRGHIVIFVGTIVFGEGTCGESKKIAFCTTVLLVSMYLCVTVARARQFKSFVANIARI